MAIMTNPISLGPWKGIDNTHQELYPDFQLGDRLKAVTELENFRLTDDGWLVVRNGLTSRVSMTGGKSIYSHRSSGLLLFQDGTSLYSSDPNNSFALAALATGLSGEKIEFCEVAGKVFWTDGTTHGIVNSSGTVQNWGMVVPPSPTLEATSGDLPAGRYRVSCALVDYNGVVSGAPAATTITLDGAQDITVDLASYDSNAVYVRVYASYTNTSELYYIGQVAIGALPVTITEINESNEICWMQFLQPPQTLSAISVLDGLFSWRGFVFLFRGTRIARSFGNAHHLFMLGEENHIWKLPYSVLGGGGDDTGPCFVATTNGLFKYSPSNDGLFSREQLDNRKYAKGSLILAASELGPFTDIPGRVVIFASEDGLVFGLPDGSISVPKEGDISWDIEDKSASIIHLESDELGEIFVTLE